MLAHLKMGMTQICKNENLPILIPIGDSHWGFPMMFITSYDYNNKKRKNNPIWWGSVEMGNKYHLLKPAFFRYLGVILRVNIDPTDSVGLPEPCEKHLRIRFEYFINQIEFCLRMRINLCTAHTILHCS